MAWDSIIGQQRAKNLLKAALKNQRLAHAYLFVGPDGVGKDAAAIELARVLNCGQRTDESCGSCSSCKKVDSLQHPNISLIFALPVGKNEESGDPPLKRLMADEIVLVQEELSRKAKNPYHDIVIPKATTIKVNSIREIRRASSLSAFDEGKKVFIIADADYLNDEASNALLKTLEEPHEDTMLILTTSQPDKLLPTIVSRCQKILFDPLSEHDIQTALQQREGLPADRAAMIATISNGSYAHAIQLIDSTLYDLRNRAVEFLRTALHRSRKDLVQFIESLVQESDRSDLEQFLLLLQSWLRDGLAIREGNGRIVNVDDAEAIKKFSRHFPDACYDDIFESIDRSISLLNKNVYIPLILIRLALELRKSISSASTSKDVSLSIDGR